jgi:DNA mismatch repair ATPase MutL
MELNSNEQLLLQNKQSNRTQWEKELSDQEKQLRILAEAIGMLKRHNDLQNINNEIALRPENYKINKPTWKFEENEEYMKNHREITMINHTLKQMEFENVIRQRELDQKRVKEQYDGLKEAYDKLLVEIKDMESRKGSD